MSKELEIWQFAAGKLERGEIVMMLVVAESSGSSPGRQGFKMIVAENDLRGSIGGGLMEIRLTEIAQTKIKSKEPGTTSEIFAQVHQKNSPDASGMICSGKQTVVFRRLDFRDSAAISEIVRALNNHEPKTLRMTNDTLRIEKTESSDMDFAFENQKENEFVYSEKLGLKNKLFIIGGGHCALALSELMAKMDFHISIFDDRPNLNTLAKNEFAHRKQTIDSYENIGGIVESGADVYVVVMTVGYQTDAAVIRKLIDKDFKYFGVLGSKAKMAALLRELKNDGFAAEKLNRIRTPVGIEINSRTPEEIAVSIAAEIIAVKNSAS
jgi:xanthine dehydrogenase accessory factor